MSGPPVSVLGAGPWGASLAALLSRGGRDVCLWTRREARRQTLAAGEPFAAGGWTLSDSVRVETDLEVALASELLFLAVPPGALRPLLAEARALFRPQHRMVHLVRGFEASGHAVSWVIESETCIAQTGALAGPVVPEELWAGGVSAAVVGSPFQALVDEVTAALSDPQLRVYGTLDCAGVELGGALRAPFGLAMGIARALDSGSTLPAVLLVRCLAEASRLAPRLGAKPETLAGLSGMGDWMQTAFSAGDPVVEAGSALARTGRCPLEEAALRSRSLAQRAAGLGVDMPIVESVGRILDGASVEAVFSDLMTREPRSEWDAD